MEPKTDWTKELNRFVQINGTTYMLEQIDGDFGLVIDNDGAEKWVPLEQLEQVPR